MKSDAPVVLLRAVRHGGLCLTRSLGRLGVAVYAVEPNAWSPAAFSRYCRKRLPWDIETTPPEQVIALLQEAAKGMSSRPILIPTTDAAALFVADNAEALRSNYLFPEQPPGVARSLANKASMFCLAKSCGIPAPETVYPRCRADAAAFLDGAAFPIMIKALDYGRRRMRGAAKMQVAYSRADALAKYDAMQDPEEPNLILQEYIPGEDDAVWMFNGYFNRYSECLFGATGKKLRQSPVYTGATCLGICLPNEAVAESTLRFMKYVGYRGILDIGYRYDARDGLYKVLDVNPRIGSTFRLFAGENDMDAARALYLDLTEQQVPQSRPLYGRKWIVEDADLASSFRYYLDGKLGIGEWVRSFRGIQEPAVISLRDPLPAAAVMLADLRSAALRIAALARGSAAALLRRISWRAHRHGHDSKAQPAQHVLPQAKHVARYFGSRCSYWKSIYERDDVQAAVYRARADAALHYVRAAGLHPESHVLEIGCGAGLLAAAIAQLGHRVQAIDFSSAMIELAREAAAASKVEDRVTLGVADARRLPFPEGCFDLIVALGVLPWFTSLDQPLQEFARVLRPGGHVIVTSDNAIRLNRLIDPLGAVRHLAGSGLRRLGLLAPPAGPVPRFHSARFLDARLRRAGLMRIESTTVGFGPFSIAGCNLTTASFGVKMHGALQRLADRGLPLLRSTGSQYIAFAIKLS